MLRLARNTTTPTSRSRCSAGSWPTSGHAVRALAGERILRPLGLARTTWSAQPPAARGYLVDPYEDVLRPEPDDIDCAGTASMGGLWSTVSDLLRWAAFLCDPVPVVLAPATVDEMHCDRTRSADR